MKYMFEDHTSEILEGLRQPTWTTYTPSNQVMRYFIPVKILKGLEADIWKHTWGGNPKYLLKWDGDKVESIVAGHYTEHVQELAEKINQLIDLAKESQKRDKQVRRAIEYLADHLAIVCSPTHSEDCEAPDKIYKILNSTKE